MPRTFHFPSFPRHILHFLLCVLCLPLSGLVPAHADQATSATPAPITCTRTVAGQLLLPVKLTDAKGQKVDANFILDTGVNKCGITDAMATRLGLISQPGIGDDGRPLIFNGKPAQLTRVPLLEVGLFPCPNMPLVIFDAKKLSASTGQSVDGILGNNLLVALPALINLQRLQVTFIDPGPVTSDTLQTVGMADAIPIPLDDLDHNNGYTCNAQIEYNKKSLRRDMVLDIGSGETMINGSDARKLSLLTQGTSTSSFTLLTGSANMYQDKVSSVTLGNGGIGSKMAAQVQDVTVTYPKDDLPDFLPPHLGRDVLSHFLLLMDFREKKMYVKPIQPQIQIRIGAPQEKKP